MSKKAIVNEIRNKVNLLANPYSCNLNIELPNGNRLNWVSTTQVMIGIKIGTVMFRNKKYPLYSKNVDIDMLNLINEKL